MGGEKAVGNTVETRVDSVDSSAEAGSTGLSVRMFGPLTVLRGGVPVALPSSRKARALLAFLTLSPGPIGRSGLCDLLWDAPNDPRGELRWCLSKLRNILDESHRPRVRTLQDRLALDLGGVHVDALELSAATESGLQALSPDRLGSLAGLLRGDFLEDLAIDRSPNFNAWLTAQRRRFSACHAAILEQLVFRLPAGCAEASRHLEKWVEIAPFDRRAHAMLLSGLARQGKIAECERHLAVTAQLFASEGLDPAPIRAAWRLIKQGEPSEPRCTEPAVEHLTPTSPDAAGSDFRQASRAALAVMPFLDEASGERSRGGLADGLTHDIIARLAKLRDLFIIARGTVFALAEYGVGPENAGRSLKVDYVASGSVHRTDDQVRVRVELMEAQTARIVWAETFHRRLDATFEVLDQIGNSIVSAISAEIELAERNRAVLKVPNSLNAWEAYHRGLWHMYRFSQSENELAQRFFTRAVQLDPTFARAYAGLSFTHWQNAFQRWAPRETETDRAFETAGQSLIVDDQSPAAHWAMGRALWLRGHQDQSLRELQQAVDLSPNFALGHYSLSFVHCQSGDPGAAIRYADHARSLSPFDPLLFGMLGARAMAHIRLGEFEAAAEWALKAAARPNAHSLILAIAAHCLALAGRLEEGRAVAGSIRKALPHYGTEDFLQSFRFAPDAAAVLRQAGKRIGLDGGS
jgi:DNA-binding SARP family transcriptional activator/tetratricopeptide (TPR) repeat protein